MGNSTPSLEPKLLSAFRDGLRDFGYVEGQNIRVEYRWAEGRYERFPDLIAELVRLKVDLIVVAGTPATLAAKRATNAIPIVMAVIGDALEVGVVPSPARPGSNITGLSTVVPELEGKRLELLKHALPKLSRLAVLANPANPFVAVVWSETQRAGEELRVKLQRVDVRQPEEFSNAFTRHRERAPGCACCRRRPVHADSPGADSRASRRRSGFGRCRSAPGESRRRRLVIRIVGE